MKKILVLLALICFASLGFGQSKKKINHQLNVELIGAIETYDSIQTVHRFHVDDVSYLQKRVEDLVDELVERRRLENNAREEIIRKHGLLVELNYNADSIVNLKNLEAMPSPGTILNRKALSDQFKSFALIPVAELEDLSEKKVKEQNEVLKLKIAEYVYTNKQNNAVLYEEERTISNLNSLKKEYELGLRKYQDFINELYQIDYVLARKCIEENDKKVEAQRILDEKTAAAEAKKNKNKKPIKFVPPVIVDKIQYPDEQLYYDQEGSMNVSSNYWEGDRDYAPPPVEEPQTNEPLIYEVVDEPAQFPGGHVAMMEYLRINLKYPEVAQELGIEGKCYLKFVISESGNISNVNVLKGVPDCTECDDEALRVIRAMPDWLPGKIDGNAVNSYFTIPIRFPYK